MWETLEKKKTFKNTKHEEMIMPEWLFQEPYVNNFRKIGNPKPLKQIVREINKIDDKKPNRQRNKNMINPYYFTDRASQVEFYNILEDYHNNHANSMLAIQPKCLEVEMRNALKKTELVGIYARLINEFEFKYQTVFSGSFVKEDEDGLVLDEIELYICFVIHQN